MQCRLSVLTVAGCAVLAWALVYTTHHNYFHTEVQNDSLSTMQGTLVRALCASFGCLPVLGRTQRTLPTSPLGEARSLAKHVVGSARGINAIRSMHACGPPSRTPTRTPTECLLSRTPTATADNHIRKPNVLGRSLIEGIWAVCPVSRLNSPGMYSTPPALVSLWHT